MVFPINCYIYAFYNVYGYIIYIYACYLYGYIIYIYAFYTLYSYLLYIYAFYILYAYILYILHHSLNENIGG